jgi:hypothetical protein
MKTNTTLGHCWRRCLTTALTTYSLLSVSALALRAQVTLGGAMPAEPRMAQIGLLQLIGKILDKRSDTIMHASVAGRERAAAMPACTGQFTLPDSFAVVSDGSQIITAEVHPKYNREGRVVGGGSFKYHLRRDTLWFKPVEVRCRGNEQDTPSALIVKAADLYLAFDNSYFVSTRDFRRVLNILEGGQVQLSSLIGDFGQIDSSRTSVGSWAASALETKLPVQMLTADGKLTAAVWSGRRLTSLTTLVDSVRQAQLSEADSLRRVKLANEKTSELVGQELLERQQKTDALRRAQQIRESIQLGATPTQRAAILEGRVILGMTPQMVRLAWWQFTPNTEGIAQQGSSEVVIWSFPTGVIVKFTNGRVTAVIK